MKYEAFTHSVEEYSGVLTENCHQTLYWLNRNGYLENDVTEDLLSRMVIVPIRNQKSFGERLLRRFFTKKAEENSYVFPITLLEDVSNVSNEDDDKPKLTVVK